MNEYVTGERSRRILYIEDDRVSQEYVSLSLEKRGYRVDIAPDTIQAMAKLACNRYDAIILDYHLPIIGPEMAEHSLRKSRTPICYFTCDPESARKTAADIPVIQKIMQFGRGGIPELARTLHAIIDKDLPEDYDKTRHISEEELKECHRLTGVPFQRPHPTDDERGRFDPLLRAAHA